MPPVEEVGLLVGVGPGVPDPVLLAVPLLFVLPEAPLPQPTLVKSAKNTEKSRTTQSHRIVTKRIPLTSTT